STRNRLMPRASSDAPPVRADTTSVSAEPPCSTARLSPSSTQPSPDFVARVVTRRRSQRASTSVCANAILCLPWISAGKIRARCSSLYSKFISPLRLQAERRLGDDVALDLVRAGVDGGLAHVAIAREQRGRERVEGRIRSHRAEDRRQRPGRLHHQLGQRLLD